MQDEDEIDKTYPAAIGDLSGPYRTNKRIYYRTIQDYQEPHRSPVTQLWGTFQNHTRPLWNHMAPYRSKQKQSMKHKTNQDQRVVLLGPLEPITRRAIGSRSIRTVSVPFFYSSTSSSMVKCTKKAIGYPSISKASSPSFYYSTSSSNIFLDQKFLLNKIFFWTKIFWTKNFLWIKKVFQTTKIFCIKNFFGTRIFLEPEIFLRLKIFADQQVF